MQSFLKIDIFGTTLMEYFTMLGEHVRLSLAAVCLASLIGIPLGIAGSASKVTKSVFSAIFGTLRVIPSIAVLFLCLPLMGTGFFPALTALTVLALPPIFINTALAFSSIPNAVLEAAFAMGMSERRCFFLVKLPLAFPLILTALKTATVEVLASATLAAYIGAGGFGALIFTGLGLLRTEFLLTGGISVALLSFSADVLLSRLEKWAHRYQ